MGKRLLPPDNGGGDHIEPVDLKKALEERYLAYALSTIMHRALPDVRDGLKPVHRRIMHAMRLLRLNPDQGFAKCARIVGEVMGKFHPHGDQSIYDALVRLAQDFSMRYPLVDGQGNFGNIDGDNAAAMRYTEARMTDVATDLLAGITEDAVDYRPTYNEEDEEPVVLPGAFPNLLANGSSGIAVGMATSIPPHNAAELCDAALHLIEHRDAPVAKLMDFVQGPDFPTGGIIVDSRASILEAYETGRGGFRVRSKWNQEDQGRGTWSIVVTEIPYGVQKARLIEKIAELLMARKLPLLEDIRDESAEDIRVVLVPKSRSVDPGILMESLFKLTELESRFPLNMNVLSRGKVPNVLSLKGVLQEWLDHRRDVLIRRSKFRLGEIERRLEILAGYLIAYLNIDEVIRIIREEDEPKQVMMARWSLTDTQAEAILNMRLRALRKLEEFEIRKEFDGLTAEKKQIEALLASDAKQWSTIKWEVTQVRDKFGPETELGKRRTQFADAPEHDLTDIAHAMIEREPVTVVVSEKGWLRAMKGHLADFSTLTFKEGDSLKLAFHAQTTDKVLVFTTGGKFYTIGADRLPGGRGHGEPIRIIVDMDNDQDIVTAFVHDPKRKLLLASFDANGFIVPEEEVVANTRKGKQVMNVKAPDEAKRCVPVTGDHLAIVGENRKMLVFALSEIPEMGRGKGVRLQKYKDGGLLDLKPFTLETGLSWQDSADRTFTRSREELAEWIGARASAGRMVPKGFPRTGKFG
ncbi:DNA topoisomerase IV subunit A [Mesorhizobium sp. B2-7-3]|uniref:DNA topoisomerase 4 subunit A n=1 Tax=Mesorhizobium australicum (strain HAMBI 3006 / LMG 24608 / WSM2073) TaxID=754035 RepID=L0KP55_MESAW|nr:MULTISPECIES: DNA topoisomerase IV subunit A [Mesorhizobium]AGB46896.1 DNA topoisomerase IV, A subunit, proteobacterial [Mesorhizobium australicum WSM2073]MBZ9679742.1 DNA topoisomerase IV subunit A [Mesorhizobium sp. CO1-1-2]MBZ9924906.1 DNA topoisomerase IV subunit A [Mesorhizobium sp. BR1-1-4]MBZ9974687.1 DNA topoisomerase IV subunit A [Mesorhizobium sp. BR-1-1-10]TPJ06227.1 DNA topoisomerase IV subunit A [Mesorhizobium sp. B2-7-3]